REPPRPCLVYPRERRIRRGAFFRNARPGARNDDTSARPPADRGRCAMSCAVRSRRRPPRPPARILVVEDEQLVAAGTQAILEDAGYQVAGIAATAEDAVALTAAERPDLVLMDIQLAGPRSGVEAAVEIAERFGTGIVFVSAWADSQIRQRAEPARA